MYMTYKQENLTICRLAIMEVRDKIIYNIV